MVCVQNQTSVSASLGTGARTAANSTATQSTGAQVGLRRPLIKFIEKLLLSNFGKHQIFAVKSGGSIGAVL